MASIFLPQKIPLAYCYIFCNKTQNTQYSAHYNGYCTNANYLIILQFALNNLILQLVGLPQQIK